MPQDSNSTQQPPGAGIDRTVIRELLKLTPEERLRLLVEEVRNLQEFDRVTKAR
ncbi:MAG TPA: hypothetical protein VJ901_19255 [Thermoanaerobaculia bacterium]|nr:hypothetical protein [Thermoanaerobaculia bacterium]